MTSRWTSSVPLGALLALGFAALAFDLSLPARLPSTQDWAEAAAALRAGARPADPTPLTAPRPPSPAADSRPRRCAPLPPGGRLRASAEAGSMLHLRAGIIGDAAYDLSRPAVTVAVKVISISRDSDISIT